MAVKIVTDSTSDIPESIAAELDIEVVPLYIQFDKEGYRDGVDIDRGRFYSLLASSQRHPVTSQPTPEDFAKVYGDACHHSGGIVSVHISSKLSGTHGSAAAGAKSPGITCPVEVIDSGFNSLGLALIVIEAAKLAKQGVGMLEIVQSIHSMIARTSMLGIFNTLEYAIAGGRINKATGKLVGILNVKPLFSFRHGEVVLAGVSRTYRKAMDRLVAFAGSKGEIQAIGIAHSAFPREADELKNRLQGLPCHQPIIVSELGAALGAHGGPGVLLVALIQA
jgi:DegV family protein with EDD domain